MRLIFLAFAALVFSFDAADSWAQTAVAEPPVAPDAIESGRENQTRQDRCENEN